MGARTRDSVYRSVLVDPDLGAVGLLGGATGHQSQDSQASNQTSQENLLNKWWAVVDSNHRPPDYESDALTRLS